MGVFSRECEPERDGARLGREHFQQKMIPDHEAVDGSSTIYISPKNPYYTNQHSNLAILGEQPMNTLSTQPVLDAKGQPILKGSVVSMADRESAWFSYQGLVAEPHSDMEGDGYTVPVFFDKEVCASHFRFWGHGDRDIMMDTDHWDRQHGANAQKEILSSDCWKICPRVRFFRPEELVVDNEWKFENLVRRQFSEFWVYHTINFPLVPGTHPCWIGECAEVASETALVNVWGSIYPIYVCPGCFQKWNGFRMDGLPTLKEPLPGSPRALQAA